MKFQFRSLRDLSRLMLGALAFLGGCANLQPEAPRETLRESQPNESAPTDDLSSQAMKQLLETVRAKYHLPALGAATVRSDEITVATAGVRKIGDGAPVTDADKWHLGSDTKSMTGALIGMLVDDGKLSFDSTLAQLLPAEAGAMNPQFRAVTLRQLLTHRAGFSAETFPPGLPFAAWTKNKAPLPQQRIEFARAWLKQPPAYKPGTQMIYANTGYVIAGAIAERATGKSWEELIKTRLFAPLSMTSAGFGAAMTPGKIDQPFPHLKQLGALVPIGAGPNADNPAVIGPAGTVHCSLQDWGKYARFWLHGLRGEGPLAGQKSLLKTATFRALATPPDGGDYSCGWINLSRPWGGQVLTHSGSNTMNFAVIWLAPEKDFAVLVTTNCGDGQQPTDDVATALIIALARGK